MKSKSSSYLLPLDLLDLGMGRDSFLLAWFRWGGVGGGVGRLHQTNLSPAVRSVEQSEEMETSVTQLEWRLMGELRLRPVTASQIYKCYMFLRSKFIFSILLKY